MAEAPKHPEKFAGDIAQGLSQRLTKQISLIDQPKADIASIRCLPDSRNGRRLDIKTLDDVLPHGLLFFIESCPHVSQLVVEL